MIVGENDWVQLVNSIGAKILLVVVCFVVGLNAFLGEFGQDDIEAIHTSWKVLKEGDIYVDFFQHHHPLYYYLLAPVIDIFGENVYTILIIRGLSFLMLLGIAGFTYMVSNLFIEDDGVAIWAVLLLVCNSFFYQKAIEVRPDVPQVLCTIGSFYYLVSFVYNRKTNSTLIGSSILLAVSFLFLQKAIFVIGAFGLLHFFWLYKGVFKKSSLMLYWSTFLVTVLPYYAYLWDSGQLQQYWFLNWELNMQYDYTFSTFRYLRESLMYNTIIWGLFSFGVYKARGNMKGLVIIALLLLASVCLVKVAYKQYYLVFFPFMSVLAAYGLSYIKSKRLKLTILLVIVAVAVTDNIRNMIIYPSSPHLHKIEYVLNHTSEDDYVFDGFPMINPFRKDVDFFWFSYDDGHGVIHTYRRVTGERLNFYESIKNYRPKIISTKYLKDLDHSFLQENYKRSDSYEDILIRVN